MKNKEMVQITRINSCNSTLVWSINRPTSIINDVKLHYLLETPKNLITFVLVKVRKPTRYSQQLL